MGDPMGKKLFWLKLPREFFRSKEIKKLRKIAGGDTYTLIYLEMQLLSLESGGKIYYEGVEQNLAEELALELDEDPENVSVVLSFLKRHGLLEEIQIDEFILPQVIDSIGSESPTAARVRRHREKLKALQCNGAVTECNTDKDIDIDIDKTYGQSELDRVVDVPPAEKPQASGGAQRKAGKGSRRYEYTPEFEAFWAVYPRSADKVNAFKFWRMRTKEKVPIDLLMAAAKAYAVYVAARSTPEERILHAKTFLGPARRYEEFVGGGSDGVDQGGNRSCKKNAASGKETDWEHEPDGLPPI